MSQLANFQFDFDEKFPHLPSAPIAEAVVHWRARAENTLQSDELKRHVEENLPEYPHLQFQHQLQLETEIGPEGSVHAQRTLWHGLTVKSKNELQVAQFTRDGFAFSQLAPYENWDHFAAEALRLWEVYVKLALPSEVQRLGVRFINRIVPVDPSQLGDYLVTPPRCPDSLVLPLSEFMHKNTYNVPGQAFSLNVIQAIQPPTSSQTDGFGLIIDIDVFTKQGIQHDDRILKEHLAEMRWLKNKAFFSLVTENAIRRFQEPSP